MGPRCQRVRSCTIVIMRTHFLPRVICLVPLAVISLLSACAAPADTEKVSTFGSRPVALESIRENDLSVFLASDWSKFDAYAGHAFDIFSGKESPLYWHSRLTPPLPTHWPPTPARSVTYYAYPEYQELRMHGPAYSRAAPWAKVVLAEGQLPQKMILASALGPKIHYEIGVPITRDQADRAIQIAKAGAAALPGFIAWKAIPDDAAEVKIIKDYYCQWARSDGTAKLVREHHRSYFEWLACAPEETG